MTDFDWKDAAIRLASEMRLHVDGSAGAIGPWFNVTWATNAGALVMAVTFAARDLDGRSRLITPRIAESAPGPGAQDHVPVKDRVVVAKFHNPRGPEAWYMTEYDPETRLGFGVLIGVGGIDHLGAFSLPQVEDLVVYDHDDPGHMRNEDRIAGRVEEDVAGGPDRLGDIVGDFRVF